MSSRPRSWGFRLSWIDAVILLVTPVATWWSWQSIGAMAGVIPMAVGHFFLFCNIFRIHRTKELIWAGCFLVNVSAWALADQLWWPGIIAVQSPLTIALIVWESRGPGYHGIFARRINRRLDAYLEGRV